MADLLERSESVDVIVVGAAPPGLLVALLLRRWGLRVRLIDGGSFTPRGIAPVLHARPTEVLARIGLAESLIAQGTTVHDVQIRHHGRAVSLALDAVAREEMPYPVMFTVPVASLSRSFEEALEALGVRVERDLRVEALEEHPEGLSVTLRGAGERVEVVAAGWLIGANDALDSLAALLSIPKVERPFPVRLAVVDATVHGALPSREILLAVNDEGVALGLPIPTGMRLLATLPPGEAMLSLEQFQSVLSRRLGVDLVLSNAVGFRTWQLVHWGLQPCRSGRCVLIGASPHFETPGNGQETNTGVLDAWNLAWKIACVVRGLANDRLIDSYVAERHEGNAHRGLLDLARGMFGDGDGGAVLSRWVEGVMAPFLVEGASESLEARRRAYLAASQLGHHVRASPLSLDEAGDLPGPRAGDRAPDLADRSLHGGFDGLSFTVLSARPLAPKEGWPNTRVVTISERSRYNPELIYLIRPDGMIAVRSPEFGAVDRWFMALAGA